MRTLLLLAATLGLATAHAGHACSNTEEDAVPAETPAGTFYVVNDPCQLDGCLFSIWLYEESNGHPGLQRGDEPCGGDEACVPEDPSWCEPDRIWL